MKIPQNHVRTYKKGNVFVRTQIPPDPGLQCQISLPDGQWVMLKCQIPEGSGLTPMVVSILSRNPTEETFCPYTGDDKFAADIKETEAMLSRKYPGPVELIIALANRFCEVLERLRARSQN